MLTQTAREGNVTSYTYYADGNVESLTGPRGTSGHYGNRDFTLVYHYDELKRLVKADLPEKVAGQGKAHILFEYDPRGNLLKRTEPDGGETAYTYTVRNKVKTETVTGDGKSYVTTYNYDAAGNVKEIIDRRGKTTIQEYDDLNRLVKIRYPLGNTTSYEYDADNNKTSVTDGKLNTTTFAYDLYKKLRSTTTPSGASSTTDYDRLGNVARTINALGKARTYDYDRLNRLVKETDERGGEYVYTHDQIGNVVRSIDPNGTTAVYDYTDNYQIETLSMHNPNGKSKNVSYLYDEEGAIKQVTDNGVVTSYNNFETSYQPDAYNRVLKETTSVNGKTFSVGYAYDLMDRITGITYPNAKQVTYQYNSLGEVTGMAGGSSAAYLAQAPVYDSAGFLTHVRAANGVEASYAYDDNGRLAGLSYANAGNTIKDYAFTYDNADNIVKLKKTESSEGPKDNDYVYDNENRLTAAYLKGSFTVNVKDEVQLARTAEEDLFGTDPLEEAVPGSAVKLDYAAGSIGVDLGDEYRVTRIELAPENQEVITNRVQPDAIRVFTSTDDSQASYTEVPKAYFQAAYVRKDEITVLEIVLQQPVDARFIKIKTNYDDRTEAFGLADKAEFKNDVDKLIKVYYNAEKRTELYAYDGLGNRTRETVTLQGKSPEVKNYGYYADGSRLKTNGKWAYVYDANGNVVNKGDMLDLSGAITKVKDASVYLDTITDSVTGLTFVTANNGIHWQYEYDLMNRLVKVSKNGVAVAEYTYNWKGFRVMKVKPNAQGSETKITYYVFSPNGRLLYQEEEKYGTETENFYRQYDYLFNKLFAKDVGHVGTTAADVRFYLQTDHLGSVVAATSETGAVVWSNEFLPFGSAADTANKPDGGFQFASYTYDDDAGLNYALARWQDPETGRFTSLDPIKDGVNWYVYCLSNPISFIDENGKEPFRISLSDLFKIFRIYDSTQIIGIQDLAEFAKEAQPYLEQAINWIE